MVAMVDHREKVRSEPLCIDRQGDHLHRHPDPACYERLLVDIRRDPNLVHLVTRPDPPGAQSVSLHHCETDFVLPGVMEEQRGDRVDDLNRLILWLDLPDVIHKSVIAGGLVDIVVVSTQVMYFDPFLQ